MREVVGHWRWRWQSTVCALSLLFLAATSPSQTPGPDQRDGSLRLGPLQSVRAIRSLSPDEAARSLPVHLRATVVFYDATIDQQVGTLFVHDVTGGIFVKVPASPLLPLHEGTLVDISGVSGPGLFAPIIDLPQMRIVGEAAMPRKAPLVGLAQLMGGTFDSQWVQVEGVVHSVMPQGQNMILRLAAQSGMISATTIREPGVDYERLIDADVRTYAVAASSFNQRRQLAGVHLFIPSLRDVTVLHYSPLAPFDLPLRLVRQTSEFATGQERGDRVHLRGTVTLQRPGELVCLQDTTGGLCVDTLDRLQVPLGSTVDVVGFRAVGDAGPKLTDAVVRSSGERPGAPAPILLSADEALQGTHAGEVVQLDGQIAGLNADPREPAVLIASGGLVFSAVLPSKSVVADLTTWQIGSRVRVVGICSAIADLQQEDERQGKESYAGFRLLLRSPADLTIVQQPSWWTPRHAILTLSTVLVTTLAALGWAMWLHRRVRQQTGMLKENERRYRHLAYHDPLTGLANRALLQLRLSACLEEAGKARRSLALLLLDLDGFKQINDTLGHDAGDATLRTVAGRLEEFVQWPNTVARMGGDEFVVVLLDRDAEAACSLAEQIRERLSDPLQIGCHTASVACSIGISLFNSDTNSVGALLKEADAAMYQAKLSGRNQVRFAPGERFTPSACEDREAVVLWA